MSTLKVTNIQDTAGGNSSTSEEIFEGRAKAWCSWSASTGVPTITNDFNVNSLGDLDVGYVRVNFTSALSSSSYAVTCGNSLGNSATTQVLDNFGTGSFDVTLRYDGGTPYDVVYNSVIVME